MFQKIRTLVRLYMAIMRDTRTPALAKVFPWLAVVYLLSPIDLIPDFIPVLGQTDDVLMIILFILASFYATPKDVVRENRVKVEAL